ncbi:hypothetical protein SAMN02745248_00029 [Hathewaya proteolytica DSM 3090]|uniref:Uncharacterized protein n=1 Tax=Hathewaya proteolytica DSM 3090 TaxID=1121331 RepID=A0A1M6J3I6_9CLOT|nr:hypothetical protein [Hathewaya proteolytica]SHJ41227.1 hypothetical protein SAMN02745248_00029 [Hathewaya proteolytica DSM 3090]
MNPFEEKPINVDAAFKNWSSIYPKPYNKNEVDPYTKTRIILMNGTEYEAVWFGHQFSRNCPDNDIRRELALIRRVEQQQQKVIAALKPLDETILEHTISYEQLAVDLTAGIAQNEPDMMVKAALDFALLEDFDHLYRYSDLLEMEVGVKSEHLVGHYTEIMPGRPTISEHRYPFDNIRNFIDAKTAHPLTKLHVGIITAAEQQTMNYYMNTSALYHNDIGRQLYQEIGLIEEQHVSQYGSLMNTQMTFLENLLMHEYTECYLYYSCYEDETDPYIKKIWEEHFIQEVSHLHKAAELLKKYEQKEWQQCIPDGSFPELLKLHENKNYIRNILKNTVENTSKLEEYVSINDLNKDHNFFKFQDTLNTPVDEVPTHKVIKEYINKKGQDYRYEDEESPVESLRNRTVDNTNLGRMPKSM